MATENHLIRSAKIASELYEIRDTIRTLEGDRYRARMVEIIGYLVGHMAEHGGGVIEAATALASGCPSGVGKMQILAAAVELLEPTDEGGST